MTLISEFHSSNGGGGVRERARGREREGGWEGVRGREAEREREREGGRDGRRGWKTEGGRVNPLFSNSNSMEL